MELGLTEEQTMIQQLAREFADKEVRPIAEAIDREARFPRETVARMGELGLLGIAVPEALGGSGGDNVGCVLALEEVARACASHAVIMSVNNSLYCDPVLRYGTPEQQARFLAPFASGQKLGCFALTEPEAGSDARNQSTLAVRDGEAYVLDGRKVFVTNGRESAAALVFAQTHALAGNAAETRRWADEAERGFAAQIARQMGNSQLPIAHALALAYLGRRDDAIREAQRSMEMAPPSTFSRSRGMPSRSRQ